MGRGQRYRAERLPRTWRRADADPAVSVPEDLGLDPLHRFALIYLGMPLLDKSDLEAVGELASLNRYESLLTAAQSAHARHRVADQFECDVLKFLKSSRRKQSGSRVALPLEILARLTTVLGVYNPACRQAPA